MSDFAVNYNSVMFYFQVTENVSSVTHTFVPVLQFVFVMNATMVPIRGDVLFVVDQEFQMPTTARNVQSQRKTYVFKLLFLDYFNECAQPKNAFETAYLTFQCGIGFKLQCHKCVAFQLCDSHTILISCLLMIKMVFDTKQITSFVTLES